MKSTKYKKKNWLSSRHLLPVPSVYDALKNFDADALDMEPLRLQLNVTLDEVQLHFMFPTISSYLNTVVVCPI